MVGNGIKHLGLETQLGEKIIGYHLSFQINCSKAAQKQKPLAFSDPGQEASVYFKASLFAVKASSKTVFQMLFFLKHMLQDQAPFLAGLISKNVGETRYLTKQLHQTQLYDNSLLFSRVHPVFWAQSHFDKMSHRVTEQLRLQSTLPTQFALFWRCLGSCVFAWKFHVNLWLQQSQNKNKKWKLGDKRTDNI